MEQMTPGLERQIDEIRSKSGELLGYMDALLRTTKRPGDNNMEAQRDVLLKTARNAKRYLDQDLPCTAWSILITGMSKAEGLAAKTEVNPVPTATDPAYSGYYENLYRATRAVVTQREAEIIRLKRQVGRGALDSPPSAPHSFCDDIRKAAGVTATGLDLAEAVSKRVDVLLERIAELESRPTAVHAVELAHRLERENALLRTALYRALGEVRVIAAQGQAEAAQIEVDLGYKDEEA